MTSRREIEVIVVGAGQAGVSVSKYLRDRGIDHVVLERDVPFSSWRNRWDGFVTNTPNWMNTLPWLRDRFPSGDGRAFATREEMVAYLDECLSAVGPPIRTGVSVERVSRLGGGWLVDTSDGGYRGNSVVMCNGAMSTPRLPAVAGSVPAGVAQLHSSQYRNPSQVVTERVLVVGSASSGVQICRLLAESERFREIDLAVSRVLVLPRRVIGVQTHRFLQVLGFFDVRFRSPLGRIMYSGLETRGDPIMRPSPKDLEREHGVRLYGRLVSVEGSTLAFDDGQTLETDDLTIIWCTGFRGDYGLIDVERREEWFTPRGAPRHKRGVVEGMPGLYFVGLRYQHTVASHDIYGVAKDAAYVVEHIAKRNSKTTISRAGDLR